jgi:nucleoside-diphosphate-sugar epimerase
MIAVMGAAGNVGGKLADVLLQRDQEVRVLQHRRTRRSSGSAGPRW